MEIITTEDLLKFKVELFDELRTMFDEHLKPHEHLKWLKTPDVLKMLKISPSTLQTLRLNGTLPYTKIGSTLYYDNQDILKILNDNKTINK